jgi:hypothetical protein
VLDLPIELLLEGPMVAKAGQRIGQRIGQGILVAALQVFPGSQHTGQRSLRDGHGDGRHGRQAQQRRQHGRVRARRGDALLEQDAHHGGAQECARQAQSQRLLGHVPHTQVSGAADLWHGYRTVGHDGG